MLQIKLPPEPKVPRVFKVQLFKVGDFLEQNKAADPEKLQAEKDSEEDFLGFADDELYTEFSKGFPKLQTSTPLKGYKDTVLNESDPVIQTTEEVVSDPGKRKADEILQSDDVKRMSLDLDSNCDPEALITDDEDTPNESDKPKEINPEEKKDKEENLSTPERIKRAAQARISRDSGITSPEPDNDEVLSVTLNNDDGNHPAQIEQRRASDSAASTDSFESAAEGPTLPITCRNTELSEYDQFLVDQAQLKYQKQVTDMQSLVEKVNRWHQHLKPILKESQERGHFDINEYGTEVLDVFHEDQGQDEQTFTDVMNTKPTDHIARYFLSTLMLVNTGNVEMKNLNTDVNRITDPSEILLKLKSRVRLHEEIENMDGKVPCISSDKGKKRKAEASTSKQPKAKKIKEAAMF